VDLRHRLTVGGVAIDVYADPTVDLSVFADRARRYARTEDEMADEVLEVCAAPGPLLRPVPTRRVASDQVHVEAAGAIVEMTAAMGRSRAALASGANEFPFENALRILLSRRAVQKGGLMLHAASLREGGDAIVFPGVSGAGKSTLTLRHPPEQRISEDLVVVRPVAGGFVVDGLPFIAFHRLDLGPSTTRLTGIAFPHQAAGVRIREIRGRQVLSELARAVVSFAPDGLEERIMETLLALVDSVPAFRLDLDRETSFWEALRSRVNEATTRRASCAA
jgi:hypothetical protein